MLLCPWNFPGKNCAVGCHFLLQGLFPTQGSNLCLFLLLPLRCFSRVRLCATPQTAAHQVLPSLGFSRQEHWSGLPFPSPMHEKWTGKSESEVAQSCSTLCDPIDIGIPGSSVHGIFQARVLDWVAIAYISYIASFFFFFFFFYHYFHLGSCQPTRNHRNKTSLNWDLRRTLQIQGLPLSLTLNQGDLVRALGWEDPLEKEMAIHSSTLAWKNPWTEERDRLQSMGSQRVGHDFTFTFTLQIQKSGSFRHHRDPYEGQLHTIIKLGN